MGIIRRLEERRIEINKQTPSDAVPVHADADMNGEWNRKMSSRFQVMRANLSTTNWSTAYTGCKEYDGVSDGAPNTAGQWRLPTQREQMMIWVLYPQWVDKGTTFSVSNYLNGTEFNANNNVWHTSFINGTAYNYTKFTKAVVRCVRDL